MTSRATIILASVLTLSLGSAAMAQTSMDNGYSSRGRDAERSHTRSERSDLLPAYPPRAGLLPGGEYGREQNTGWSAKIEQDRENDRNGVNNE